MLPEKVLDFLLAVFRLNRSKG